MKKTTAVAGLLATTLLGTVPCLNTANASSADQTIEPRTLKVKSHVMDLSIIPAAPPKTQLPADWWQNAVFYQVFVRSFSDSNGDGHGDIQGLIDKLDYIEALGVRGIWLMPMTLSHFHTNGYAVVDHRKLETDYGEMKDFQRLLEEAHKRDIGIIVDYVMNHAGVSNPLFRAVTYGRNQEYKNWFVWRPDNPGWTRWDGRQVWHGIRSGEHYYGVFWSLLPDFNLKNPDVLEYHYSSMRYWLNMGVDGFRFDAVKQFVENGASAQEDQPETLAILKDVQALVKSYDNTYMVCEAPGQSTLYSGDEACGSAFSFRFGNDLIRSVKHGRAAGSLAENYWHRTERPYTNIATLLANHDPFAGKRLMEQFSDDEARYKLAATLLLTHPGQPFVYYGEEIGMRHVRNESNKDFALRGPMSWQANKQNGGFTEGRPYRGLATNVMTHNVAMQEADPNSLLNTYRELIKLRNNNPALQNTAPLTVLTESGDKVAMYLRQSATQTLLVVVNLDDDETSISLADATKRAKSTGDWHPIYTSAEALNTGEALSANSEITLPPLSATVLELKPN
ncbi:alpha-amylase family glycosyl hydrolase [Corallincola platygyrae]|uniref:Alpha-amylase family glycosyl hydrolase n=1 Tax=Corallincola platygyrae TaxID=1193278 RepID=A0ABW4XQG3_9GAMM